MQIIRNIFISFFDFILRKREITMYFQTINLSDALLSLWYSFSVKFGLAVAKNGRELFLKEVNELFDSKASYMFGSARSGLYALLKSLDFEDGTEVVVTGYTCDVVPNAIIQAGCVPVYADIDPKTYGMDVVSVSNQITNKTKVIIIQHTFGIPADIDSLISLASKHSLYVIEDCAVSLGSNYKGKLTGTFGDAAIFSFELSKTITSCRGGLLLLNNNKLNGLSKQNKFYASVPEQTSKYSSNILFQLGLSGILYRPIFINLGKIFLGRLFKSGLFKVSTPDAEKKALISDDYLIRLSNEQATILLRQWKNLDSFVEHGNKITNYYFDNLKFNSKISPSNLSDKTSINFIRYPILTDKRNQLIEEFQKNKIELGLWFTAPLTSPQINHDYFGYKMASCQTAEKICNNICNLPVHKRVRIKDAKRIVDILNNIA